MAHARDRMSRSPPCLEGGLETTPGVEPALPISMRAKDLKQVRPGEPSKRLLTVCPETTVGLALRAMRKARVHHAVVMKDSHCLGVVSAKELIASTLGNDEWHGTEKSVTVGETMRQYVPPIAESTDAKTALSVMLRYGVTALPLERDGRVTGILTETDLANAWERGK